jgi:uncharacterized membrane protein
MSRIKSTIIAGIVFLIPFLIITLLLGKVFDIMLLIADPIGDMVTPEGVADFVVTNLLAALLVLVICFLAGLLAKSAMMQRLFASLDRRLTLLIPGYAFFRSAFRDLDPTATAGLKPVVVRLNDMRQLGFWVEDVDENDCIVFFPIAPEPRSGTVAIVEKSRVTELDTGFINVVDVLNRLGTGGSAVLPKTQE